MSNLPAEIQYRDFSLKTHEAVGSQGRFVKAQIELTYGCNLHCVHCYTDPLNRPDLLKKELLTRDIFEMIDTLHREGIFWLAFTGGEIFWRKDFLEIYDYAYKKGFLISLLTNGTLINEEIANHLRARPPLKIEISFHGADPETFDKITKVKGSFEKCVRGIQLLLERDLPVKLKTHGMTLNRGKLEGIKKYVEGLGLQFHINSLIYPRLDGDTSSCDYRLYPEELIESHDLEETPEESCKMIPHQKPEQATEEVIPNTYRCGCGQIHMHMDPYGRVGSCTWQRKHRFHFKEKPFQQGMEELSEKILGEKYNADSVCHSCVAAAFCEKMPEMAVHENQDTQKPVEYFCDLAFERKNRLQ